MIKYLKKLKNNKVFQLFAFFKEVCYNRMEKGPSTYAEYWTSPENEVKHFKHAKEFGFDKLTQYSQSAKKFAENNERGIKSFRAMNGSIYKYSSKTNEFMIISKDGKIVTYFKPTNPHSFIENKFDECGDYWINY